MGRRFHPVSLPSAAGTIACDVPEELMQFDDKLPHLAERLRAKEPVKIVAIGGASTTGLAAGSSELAYPHRLQEILAQWYPASPITVVNRGVPGKPRNRCSSGFQATCWRKTRYW